MSVQVVSLKAETPEKALPLVTGLVVQVLKQHCLLDRLKKCNST